MKHVAFASLVLLVAAFAVANGPGMAPPPGGPGHGPEGGPGEHAIIGSDGTLYITKVTASATAGVAPAVTVTAIRSTGTTAWTATLPSGAHGVELSDGNLLTVTETTATDGTVTSTLNAISTTTGASAWTKAFAGRINEIAPFSGGTYVFSVTPAATTGGAATHTLTAVSNSGSTLWTVTL
jgi:hypothetical protein